MRRLACTNPHKDRWEYSYRAVQDQAGALLVSTGEFEQALSRMAEGELSAEPVESRYRVHVIHLHRRIDGAPLEFEQVGARIAEYLRERVWRRAFSQYLQILIGQAEIRGIELPGADSPLVQ